MKFSETWLREWVNPAVDTQTLVSQLTMAGIEVDSLRLQRVNSVVWWWRRLCRWLNIPMPIN